MSADRIIRWAGVLLAPGTNTVEVAATQNSTTYTDAVTWYAPGG